MAARLALFTLVVLITALSGFAQSSASGPWDIAVDVGAGQTPPTVNPVRPVARIGDDDYLSLQILVDGKVPPDGDAALTFPQRVLTLSVDSKGIQTIGFRPADKEQLTEKGASHLIRFHKCNDKSLSQFQINGHTGSKTDCPLIVSNGVGNVTVYANSDSIALDATAKVSMGAGAASTNETKHARFTIRTVRPWWNLNFSSGFSFFAGDHLRDEQVRFEKFKDDPATPADESATTDQKIVRTGNGEAAYELGAFATYMLHRPTNIPVGLTFGVSSKIPVDQLTAVAGVSVRIEPFPIVNSAYITTGIAYRGHKVLAPKYRDTLRVPAGVTEANVFETRHDIGLVVAVSFGFGGGEAQFKKVVSGGQ